MSDNQLGLVIDRMIEHWSEGAQYGSARAGPASALEQVACSVERSMPGAVLERVKAAPRSHREVIGAALARLQQDPAMRDLVEKLAAAPAAPPVEEPAPRATPAGDGEDVAPVSSRPSVVFHQQSGVQTAGNYVVNQGTVGGDLVAGDRAVNNYGGGNTFGAGSVVSVGGNASGNPGAALPVPKAAGAEAGTAAGAPDAPPAESDGAPMTILFVGANPLDGTRLRLDEEVRGIDAALRRGSLRDRLQLQQHLAVRMIDLQEALLRYHPHVLHFSGHGSESSAIYIEDGAGGSMAIPPDLLSRLLSGFSDHLRCVVLNACYSEGQARAIAAHIDCVVGMAKAVGDRAAIGFAAAFYQALAYGSSVQAAFDMGCMYVQPESPGEENTPRLISLRRDAKSVVLGRTGH